MKRTSARSRALGEVPVVLIDRNQEGGRIRDLEGEGGGGVAW